MSTDRPARPPGVDASGPAPAELPAVLHGAPAAVLLIDLDRREVTYVNGAAAEIAGDGVRLPVDVDAWSEAAGLTDLSGRPMRETGSPLSTIATGRPVAGEAVEVHDAARRGSPATPAQRERTEGRLLWVTGFPLAPGPRRLALVVLLQLGGAGPGTERRMELLRDRAVVATDLSFSVSDPSLPDAPLVWVNPAFTRLTGYGAEEAVGRNCRFLQGPNTDRAAVRRIREAVAAGRPITEVLLNYRKDGSAFWNQASISPVLDADGAVVNYVGVQYDVTERVLVENERNSALAAAEAARADLRLLTDVASWVAESLDGDARDVAARLARTVVPALGDYCCVDLLPEPGAAQATRVAVAHRDPAAEDLLRELAGYLQLRVGGTDQVSRVLTTGEPVLLAQMPERPTAGLRQGGRAEELYRRLRPRSCLLVPLRARGRVLGVLTLATEEPYGRRYGQRELLLAGDVAAQGGLAIDNARLYALQYEAAQTLQRSLLPRALPRVPGLRAASRYLVGSDGARVGGDWYDLLALPDGAVGLAVGDVVGHDLTAAAAMGQLRGLVRSYAWEGLRPGAVLDRCDQLVQGLEMAAMATAVYARLEPDGARGHRLVHASAGHPPLLLRTPDGATRFVDGDLSPLIGAVRGVSRGEVATPFPPGSILVLHTDGLTDVPGADADARQERLCELVRDASADVDVEELCDRIVAELAPGGDRHDDVALLCVRSAP